MKRLGIFAVAYSAVIFMLMFAFGTIAYASVLNDSAYFTIGVLEYQPYPAEPGKYITLRFNAENSGLYAAEHVTFELDPEYPFSIDPNEDMTRYFGSVNPRKSVVFEYKVRVAADAVEGNNEIKLRYRIGDSGAWVTEKFNLSVQTPDAVVAITNVKTEPEYMVPGKVSDLTISLKNMADSPLKDISLKLDLSTVSLYPLGTATEQKVYIIESGKSSDIKFKLLASSSIEGGAYKIPITLTYSDMTGVSYSKSDYVTVIVSDTPDIITTIEETEILAAGENGEITINLINKGLIGIKLLYVTLGQSSDYEILSPASSVYIGSLEADDYDTASFIIYVKPTGLSEISLPLKLDYMDDNNKEFSENIDIELRLYTQEEITRLGLRPAAGTSTWLILLIVAVVGYLVYRKFFRKKR